MNGREPSAGDAREFAWSVRRAEMVRDQIAARGIADPRVLAAVGAVPRHEFVPDDVRGFAYDDRALPIGFDQTISQPYIVALMTETLAVRAGGRVLEIGTGSGYQAAVLHECGCEVYTVEIVEPLAVRAAATLARPGYAGIRTRTGDGRRGWPEAAPFDAIVVACAPDDVPAALPAQLADGGRMVIPVGPAGQPQQLVVLSRRNGVVTRKSILPVSFVPMTGGNAG